MSVVKNKPRTLAPGSFVNSQDLPFEVALRRFRKKVEDSGLIKELRERMHYEKPTTVRKAKKNSAKRRWERELQKQQLPNKNY